jgi:imidazole glycerol phosphate synthase subunit HisF
LIRAGVEKVVINTQATESMNTILEAVKIFGCQAIVGAVDVRKIFLAVILLHRIQKQLKQI